MRMSPQLLTAYTDDLKPDFLQDQVRLVFNQHTGEVFLTDSDLTVAMINGDKLEQWFHCPVCGHSGFLEDMQHEPQNLDCTEYMAQIGLFVPQELDTPYKWSEYDYMEWIRVNSKEEVPRKWVYITQELFKLNAPFKVLNAAIELDNALVRLGLGYNTADWIAMYPTKPCISKLIVNKPSCSACEQSIFCNYCVLGDYYSCTPRNKHADDYYGIVGNWISPGQ